MMLTMQNDLIGYLLGALDAEETSRVKLALDRESSGVSADGDNRIADNTVSNDHRLAEQLQVLRSAFRPLEADRIPEPAPAGLADRTLQFVRTQAAMAATIRTGVDSAVREAPHATLNAAMTPEPAPPVPMTRSFLDRLIIGATAIAATVLLAPLLLDTIEVSRTRLVEQKLGTLAGAIHGYGDTHREFPTPPPTGPLSRAGLYAPTLVAEHRLRADGSTLLVPGSPLSQNGRFRVPTLEELEAAVGTAQLEMLVRQMGGDFGYTLGHRDESGQLQPNRDTRRGHHPLMADAPADHGLHALHHSAGMHHVLFEDGRVQRVFDPTFATDRDHLYRNHDGELAAGVDVDDSAIGGSHHQP
jgi:hypothetical protein